MEDLRAEIIVNGLVQGVGFRYFVYRNALKLGLKGFTQNLFSGEVLTVVEGPKYLIDELYEIIKIGPRYADVKNASIKFSEAKNEFINFEIKY
ncbi:MAG: acylphosphatase [Stygiobacter sp.]|jgi:acylphosphatase|uniref:acylphosphatase n=1 Tax=Stygiobacter electus TaxID=3032292 RepID=A0AAE3P293_9BACT|nr:acylphosphatase [Stygiobacter electus]MDF1612759.1 acylphosphatase [Stygiobacter electus]